MLRTWKRIPALVFESVRYICCWVGLQRPPVLGKHFISLDFRVLLFEILGSTHPYVNEDIEELKQKNLVRCFQLMHRRIRECKRLQFPEGTSNDGVFLLATKVKCS